MDGLKKETAPTLEDYGTPENLPVLVHPSPHHSYPNPSENEGILGVRLLKLLASPFATLTRSSQTLLRLDLRRPVSFPKRPPSPRPAPSSSLLSSVHGSRARLQLMQTWDFPPKSEEEAADGESKRVGGLNLGIGASVEMDDDGGVIVPKARVKTRYAILQMLPKPCLELRTKFPVGVSSLAASIRCRIPLTDLENMWNSPTSQLTLNFYNEVGSGFHLTPGGLEFDEHLLKIGRYTTVRVAASINFPRRLPPEDDDQPLRFDIRSIGLKTRII